jgi:iron complex outermembrane receptor protein
MTGTASVLALGAAVWAPGAQAADAAAEPTLTSEVVVTGTRRAGVTVTDSPTPIDVVSGEKLSRQGFTDTNDLLKATVPSLNVQKFSVQSFSVAVRPFSLRGLSPDQTLVLVNGKRRHRSAIVQISRLPLASGAQGPDLSTIPSIAIERVEVLRDGAAAQYGSDAIAGVVNFQLKQAPSGGQVVLKYGQYYEGDGEDYLAQGNIGLPLGPDGFLNISGEYSRAKPTYRQIQRQNAALLRAAGNTAVEDPAQPWGDPNSEGARVFANAELPLGEAATAYAFGNYADTDVSATQFWRSPDVTGAFPANRLDIFASVPLTATPGGARFTFASLYPSGLLPVHHYNVKDASLTGGVRGEILGGLKYDLSGGYAESKAKHRVTDTVNPSLGPTAPTEYDTGSETQQETQLHADFVYSWENGVFATPLNVAFGAEYRKETFKLGAGEPDSYRAGPFARVFDPDRNAFVGLAVGASAFPGIQPSQAGGWSRNNKAVYLDLEADVIEKLTIGLAGRYEDFSDFGDTFNYKISGRYEISDALALRASYNTGFRAPTPGQSHISARSTSINLTTGALLNIATLPVDSAIAQYYGAAALEPEESKNYSVGAVITLDGGFVFTADYFNIRIDDRIGVTSAIPITAADRAALTARGLDASDLNSVAFFANAFDTKTQGVDLVASQTWTLDDWRIDLSGALNYTKTTVTKITDARAIDRERSIEIGSYYPKWRGTLTGVVTRGPWSGQARLSYFGKYTDAVPTVTAVAFDQTHGPDWLLDLEVSYDVSETFRVSVGANNILDHYPDKEGLAANINNGQIYTQNSPFGYNGGFWYARLSARF